MKPYPTAPFEAVKSTHRIASFVCALVSVFNTSGAPTAPPNLIIILTDDQGYHDVGFNGCTDIPTPNLDSIASNGVRFTSGYVSSALSSPGRAGLLTGRYPERFGYERNPTWPLNNSDSGLPLTETTLADSLGQVGYETGMIGKWHLGSQPAMHPLKRGFKEFFGFLGAGHRYLPEGLTLEDAHQAKTEYDTWLLWILRNREPVRTTNYLTDEFSDEAVRFIARQKDQPFFLLLSYNAPHDPLEAPEKYTNRFPKILGPHRRTYAAMMSAVDDGVGSILAELRKAGLTERTLVVYLSAGGGALEMNSSDSYPWRGAKSSLWEGGWRVPLAMQWPGHLPKGMVYDRPVLSLDIFATIAALANVPISPERPLDGVNLIPYLTGLKPGAPHDALYLRIPERTGFAVRSGDYKLVSLNTNQPAELYDLSRDISETKNLADQKPEVVRELEKKYADWSQRMMPPTALGTTEQNEPPLINTDAEELKADP